MNRDMAEQTITILKVGTDEAVNNIGDLRANIRQLKEELSKLKIGTAEYQNTLKTLITNQNALRGAMNATTASFTDVAKAASATTKAYDNENGQVKMLATTYNGLVNQLANLKRELRNVDISTTEGMETYKAMAVQVDAVNTKLKEMDALQGNYQRNVGNYRSALNGLNLATAQVVRELPSLAISANTFFLAISNNIPILVDQIANLRAQNAAAVAQGGKAVSILGAVVKSFFSWNTVLTLVITAVTLFGDDLLELIGNLFKAKEAVDANAEAMKRYREAVGAATKAEGDAIATAKLLYDIATDEARSMEDRLAAVRQLQKEYPDYLGNMSEEEILTGKAKKSYDELVVSLMEYAKTKAYVNKIAEQEGIILQEQIDTKDARQQLDDLQKEISEIEKQIDDATPDDIDPRGLAASYYDGMTAPLQERLSELKIQAKELTDLISESDTRVADAQSTIEMLKKEINPKYVATDDNNGNDTDDSEPEDNTLDYIRQMQDAQLALLGDGYEKQLAERKLYYERQIEDLQNTLNTEKNLTAEGRAAINETIRALNEQWLQEEQQIMSEWSQSQADIYQETIDAIIKDGEELSRELDRQEKENEKRIEREQENAQRLAEQRNEAELQQVDKDTDHKLAMNDSAIGQTEWERQENEYNIIKEGNERKLELLRQFSEDALDAGNLDAWADYQLQIADLGVRIEEDAARRKKKVWDDERDAKISTMFAVANATSSILGSLADMYEEDAENNEKSAQKAKNLRIASTTIETISGAVGAFMQASQTIPPPYGQIIGAVQAASVLATGMAQIAKIKNTKVDKDSAPSGSAGTMSAVVSAPTITPQITEVRNITSASEEDRLNRMAYDQRVYILSSDIEASQNQRRARVRETSF